MTYRPANMGDLIGLTIKTWEVSEANDRLRVTTTDGRAFVWEHLQDCCERVEIIDIVGDPQNLMNPFHPLTVSELSTNSGDSGSGDSQTWSFYRFATRLGWVVVRWLGESNGYYSEEVDMREEVLA